MFIANCGTENDPGRRSASGPGSIPELGFPVLKNLPGAHENASIGPGVKR